MGSEKVYKTISKQEHKLITAWAADCAEHVLWIFEKHYPDDTRPRQAIAAAREWISGKLKTSEARKLAFAAHAAARDASNPEAIAAARSAGHAAATAHVNRHAKPAATYALKAVANPVAEGEWQQQRIPEAIKTLLESDF